MTRVHDLKSALLFLLIAFAAMMRCITAEAAEPQRLVVAGGCFWCVESDFESVSGVVEVVSGYTGGSSKDPTYKQVTSGSTGHYEAVEILFDPDRVTRRELLSKFVRSIDPTDAGGQFCDRGASYRTAIFVSDQAENSLAREVLAKAQAELGQNIVTPILEMGTFYPAEDYHQDYYKGTKLVLTRFGPRRQSTAYKLYRDACGRDDRVQQLWGKDAPFVHG